METTNGGINPFWMPRCTELLAYLIKYVTYVVIAEVILWIYLKCVNCMCLICMFPLMFPIIVTFSSTEVFVILYDNNASMNTPLVLTFV